MTNPLPPTGDKELRMRIGRRWTKAGREKMSRVVKESGKSIKHGFSLGLKTHPFLRKYLNINQRCQNPNHVSYKDYGARGIKNCFKNFEEFRDVMWKPYQEHVIKYGQKNSILDRIDVNGDYSKDNCRWVTAMESINNTRVNKKVTRREIADGLGITLDNLTQKIIYWGSVENAIKRFVDMKIKKQTKRARVETLGRISLDRWGERSKYLKKFMGKKLPTERNQILQKGYHAAFDDLEALKSSLEESLEGEGK